MKVILDENVPYNLRKYLPGHQVTTVVQEGWGGFKNGELLDAIDRSGLHVFVTGDHGIPYQNELAGRQFGSVMLSAIGWRIINQHLAKIASAVEGSRPGTVTRVDCGRFVRGRNP